MASKLTSSVPVDPPNQLTINDLPEVLQLLRRHGYSGTSYYSLFFCLGLFPATLNVIIKNNSGDSESCLRDCLKVWLQKADDVQETKSCPTIYSLVSALRELGENGVADGIDMEKHPACRILARYSSNQFLLSALPQLGKILSSEVIGGMTLSEGGVLLAQIKKIICKDYRKLGAFADILCKYTATAEIGNAIMRDYREAYESDDENVKVLKIYLPVSIISEFKSIQLKFGQTFIKAKLIVMRNRYSPGSSLDNIKIVLGAYDKTLSPQVAQCQNIRDVFVLVCDNSSLDDISMLEYFVNVFYIEEAKPVVEDYKEAVENLKMNLCQFLEEELLKASSVLESVTIVVDEDTSSLVLKDVQRLSSAVLPYRMKLNVIRRDGDDSMWRVWKRKSFIKSFDDAAHSKDTTFATELTKLPGTTDSVGHSYQEKEEEDRKDENQVMLLQEKVESIQKQLEEEKELHEKEKQFHEQVIKECEEEIFHRKMTLPYFLREEKISALAEKRIAEKYKELISDNELTHEQVEELQEELKEEKKISSSLMKQKEDDLKEKEELQKKIDDLQQELEQVLVQSDYTVTQSELQSKIQKIKSESETFQKQRKALILENERLMSLIKDHNVPIEQKEEYEILQETETVHTCTYISKGDILQLSVILEPVEDDWYHIGQCLEVKESVLTEIKEMTPVDSRLTHVLETWCHEKDRTITELKESLKRMDRDDILEGLHELPTGQYTMNNDEEYDINVKYSKEVVTQVETKNKEIQTTQKTLDKEIQFNYLVPSQDNLEGLSESQIAGKKLFLVQGDKPQLMNWEEYGLRISVPEDSLSASETVEVSVLALVGGHFKFPDSTRLVSAVYAISTSPLLKSLRIEMQHCIDLSDPSLSKYLKFAVAPVHTASLPYQFSIIEGGEFPAYQRYGWIERSKFCQLAIVGKEEEENGGGSNEERNGEEDGDSGDEGKGQREGQGAGGQEGEPGGGVVLENLQQKEQTKEQSQVAVCIGSTNVVSIHSNGIPEATVYAGQVFYQREERRDLMRFTAARDLNALHQYIEKKYSHPEIDQSITFKLKSPKRRIKLKFDEEQSRPTTGWEIIPHLVPCQ
uniref:Death domain-containing protein n=1 Tax=Amphimedon queenslandica TaxID=400682 RepID=A0A1X7UT66_AMPQE